MPECPTEAIFDEEELPEKWNSFIEINAKHSIGDDPWPVIDAQQDPMDIADDFKDVEAKVHLLSTEAGVGS